MLHKSGPLMKKFSGQYKIKLFTPLKDTAQDLNRGLAILEIGAGTGANFEYYPDNSVVTCIDPNSQVNDYFEANARKCEKVCIEIHNNTVTHFLKYQVISI